MDIANLSLFKKLLILGFFAGFFSLIFLLAIHPKEKSTITNTNTSPTKVPVVISQNSKNSLPKSEIQSSSGKLDNSLGTITFNISSSSLPKAATLYNISPSSIPTEMVGKIKSLLLPTGSEKIIETPNGKVSMITQNQKTLMVYSYSRTITFTDSAPTPPPSPLPFVERARSFINSLSLAIDNSDPQIEYYSTQTSDLIKVDNERASDVVDVSFREAMNTFVVYRQFGSDSRTHVWITKSGAITKFTYLYSPVYEPRTTISLPTLLEAQDMMVKNEGTIVSMGDEYQQGAIGEVSNTTFTKVSFGYFSDTKNNALYPIFVFYGNSFVNGAFYPAVIYLPVDGNH